MGTTINGIPMEDFGVKTIKVNRPNDFMDNMRYVINNPYTPDNLRGKIAETKREPYDRYGFPQIEKIIHNNPKTVVIWSDKIKTIVSCGEDAEFDEYVGFTAAVMKKIFGSNTKVKKIMKAKTVVSKKGINNGKI